MACTILINSLQDGQDIMLPWLVSGSASGGSPTVNITSVARQIDDGNVDNLNVGGLPSMTAPFEFELNSGLCPQTNVWYMLTVYAWDSESSQATTLSLTFRVIPMV